MSTEPAERADVTAFDDFYRAEYRGATRLAHVLTGDAGRAEDLAQEAFVRVHRHWDRVDNPGGYLRTTVVNVCRSHHRSRGRERDRLARLPVPEPAALGADELLDAVDALPYRQRAVLVLRYYEDLSEAEIANALGCRPGTVKSLASRALARLRKVVEP